MRLKTKKNRWAGCMVNTIDVTNKAVYNPLNEIKALFIEAVEKCLASERIEIPVSISIELVEDEEIKRLNREYRNIDKATDVLSFPSASIIKGVIQVEVGDVDPDTGQLVLGDIIISVQTAIKQAEEYEHSLLRELLFLVTHGMYHILGYDHEIFEDTMFEKQELILNDMGYSR